MTVYCKADGFDTEGSSLAFMPSIRFSGGTLSLIVSLTSSASTITALDGRWTCGYSALFRPGESFLAAEPDCAGRRCQRRVTFGGDSTGYYFNLGSVL